MTGMPRPDADPSLLAWLAFTAVAFTLARFAPAWTAALCVPAAGLIAWLIGVRRSAGLEQRLRRSAEAVGELGTVAAASLPAPPPRPIPDDLVAADALDLAIRNRGEDLAGLHARLLESRAVLRGCLNAVDTPVISTDEAGRVTLINRAAERLLKRTPGSLVGVPFEELVSSSAILELHARAEGGEACRRSIRLPFNGAPRFYEVSAVPVRLDIADIPLHGSQRAGVVLTLRDVHDLAQTLQLRTDFVANASHELRTPIASLRAAVETMRGVDQGDAAMQERLLGMLDANIARLEEMISDLLDLSRLESDEQPLRVEPFDGVEMGEALRALFEPVCRKRSLEITLEIDPALRRMRTDRKLVLLILRNLVDNATKFAFEGTTVRVSGSPLPAAAGPLGARFEVADRGVGIPLKHQERIFERFYQVDESRARLGARRGSGLGLAIVKHALRRLDGEITVDSVWQEGTTMTVLIPRCVDPPGPGTPGNPDQGRSSSGA
jgi:two-component system phosphate regulon sensor histidine kinase PhoR